ncbi:Retrovirus-related Pol polyprotein from transposon RE1 [Vitis vinifera]|uniref:Retrovirus-related Pol polyprotein from transposon RE1 n=1 Tax=Vitis vinifera TaxID=29760 RepID=A0A438D2W1_VITVI|nr:Retrovirus-related Pol polyprotein from transposon RE1 [Vitis vinifera]
MGSALDTFCGQSFGAKQYHMLGIHKQRAMVVLLSVSIPVAFIWSNTGYILASLGQDPEISAEAGLYAHFMIPSIFTFTLLQCYDFHHFIDGAHTPPPPIIIITGVASPNPTYTTWKCQDRLIFSALLGAISVSLQLLIARTTTSLDAWQTLANTYAKPSCGHIKQLKEQLQRCTKGSLTYWTYTFATAIYLINRMPTPTLHLSSPFDKLFESPPNYTKLPVFSCLCYPLFRPYSHHKLDFCSTPCVFLGYSSTQSAYIVHLGRHPISLADQLVDALTKPLPRSHFQELQVKIGVSSEAPS